MSPTTATDTDIATPVAAIGKPATLQEFEAMARALGYDEVLVRDWTPGQVVGTHSHPFDAKAVVVQGEMTLSEGEGADRRTRVLGPGDWFELRHGTPHDERYGPDGATYWVARRNA